MSLQTILQEMQREEKIDKSINAIMNRFLKTRTNRKYRVVSSREQAHAILIFKRNNLSTYSFILNEENNENIDALEQDNNITLVYLKSTNPHDAKRVTQGDIKNIIPAKKNFFLIFEILVLKNL